MFVLKLFVVVVERLFLCQFFSFPQIEKQMSCVMGIPGPVHNPSCSSAQVHSSSQFEALMSPSCFCGLFLLTKRITFFLCHHAEESVHLHRDERLANEAS